MRRTAPRLALAFLLLGLPGPALAQEAPPDPSEVINALLGSLMGFREVSGPELQKQVAEVGGVPFRRDVPLDYMSREELSRFLRELLDAEYPAARAEADARTLAAFDLVAPDTDLRALRARLLEENVAGFYDERPGRKRLYAVSAERSLTPANQIILAHELRHALQDQYVEVHAMLPDSVGDFDDRRMALMSLLEGDATLVMERFLLGRLPGAAGEPADLSGFSLPAPPVAGAPPVLRDQLVLPYIVGRDFAIALWKRGGWDALKAAWLRPPASTEQVLHAEKFESREAPREVEIAYSPRDGRLLNEGILGEILIRTLLGDGAEAAAAGWGGDRFRLWDVSGRTLLVWQSIWDTPADLSEFFAALQGRFARSHQGARPLEGFALFGKGRWSVALGTKGERVTLIASDDAGRLLAALRGRR